MLGIQSQAGTQSAVRIWVPAFAGTSGIEAAGWVCDTMRHLLQCRHGIPIFGWTKRSVWEDFHAFLARSSAACALRRGGGAGLRDDRCRCPRRSRRKLRQSRLAKLLRAALDDDLARRAAA